MVKDINRAQLVKEMREERAWPQRQLAEIAGINTRTVQRLEKDGSGSSETLMAIASAFEIDVKQLQNVASKKDEHLPRKNVHLLPRLTTGKSLTGIVYGADFFEIDHDTSDDQRAVNAMISVLEELKLDIVRWHDANLADKLKIEMYLSEAIKELGDLGFYIFGTKRMIPRTVNQQTMQVTMCTIYMSHSLSPKIVKDSNSNMAMPAILSEVAK